ncbi:MAG TPA: hypothetical protein VJ890_14530 [Vineibacter sp.]|nr:hypothetical protein [Vineibacter sp.]
MSSLVIDDLEGVRSSKAFKTPCRAATTGNIALSGLQTIDGVALAEDDRVLVKDQVAASDNGVYKAAAGAWSRAEDFDGSRDIVSGSKLFVTAGVSHGRREFYLQTADPITIGATALAFALSEPVSGQLFDIFLSKSAPYTVVAADEGAVILVDTSGGAVTITLPTIASVGDFKLGVAKTTADASAVTIARAGSDTINGATSLALTAQHETATLVAKGGATSWLAVDRAGVARLNATQAMSGAAVNWAKGADIASAATTDIGAASGNYVTITGTTTITALGTAQSGTWRLARFAGALTLTHNATSLILPTGGNITTRADDCALFVSEGSGNWRCAAWFRKDGSSVGDSGTYTPTLTNVANLDGTPTAYESTYVRIGNVVHVFGRLDADPTAGSTLSQIGISLPVSSNFSALEQCAGTINGVNATEPGMIWADTANDRADARFVAASTASHAMVYAFSYRII